MSLHVGNLSRFVKQTDLESVFRRFGSCQVYMKEGYAFAKFPELGDAEKALQELIGKPLFNGNPSISWSRNQPGQPRKFPNGDHVRGNSGPWPGVQFPCQGQAQAQAKAAGFVADACQADDLEKGGKAGHNQGGVEPAMAGGEEANSVWDQVEERVDLELGDEESDVVFMDKASKLKRHPSQQEKSGTGAGEVRGGICSPANGLVQLQASSTPGTPGNDALTLAERWRGPSVPPAAEGERRGQEFGGREPGAGQLRRSRWSPSRPGWCVCSHCGKPGHTMKYCRFLGNGSRHVNSERQHWGNSRSFIPRDDFTGDRRESKGGQEEREKEREWEKGNERDRDGEDRYRRQDNGDQSASLREKELVSNGGWKRRLEEGEITDHCTSVSKSNKSRRSPSPVESESSGRHPRRDFRREGRRSRDRSSSSEGYRMEGSSKRSLTRIPSSGSRSQRKTYSWRQSGQVSPPLKRTRTSMSRSSLKSESRSPGRSPSPLSDCQRTVSTPSEGTRSRSYSPASISLAGSRSGSPVSRRSGSQAPFRNHYPSGPAQVASKYVATGTHLPVDTRDKHARSRHLRSECMSRKDAAVENGGTEVQACKRIDRESTKLASQPVPPSSGTVKRDPVVDPLRILHRDAGGRERRTVDEKSRCLRINGSRHEDVALKKDHANYDDMEGKEEKTSRMRAYDTMNFRRKPLCGVPLIENLKRAAGDREPQVRSSKKPASLVQELAYGNSQLQSSPKRCETSTLVGVKVQMKSSEEMVDQWLESPRTHDTSGAPHDPSVTAHEIHEQGLAKVDDTPSDAEGFQFAAARCWTWEAVLARRLLRGPISLENYARRKAQNVAFGIVDKYVRSSSSWWERDFEGKLLEPDRI